VAHHQAGRLEQARELYELILRDAPMQFDAAHLLGVVAMQQGRLDDAQREIRSALTIKPTDQAALINLTAVYLRTGQLDLAAESGEAAARLLPVSIDAMINYGTVLFQMGRHRDAIEPLEIARSINPNSTVVANLLGSCLLKTGDASKAAAIFELATVQSPEDSDGWANLSAALTMLLEHDRALVCANKALELSLDSSNALAAQAAAQFELGKIEESIATYEKAVTLNPTVMILCRLAVALITSGRPNDALPYLRRAAAINGSNPYVRLISAVSELKPIYRSETELQESRNAFDRAITELQAWSSPQPVDTAYTAVGASQPFFLAYHPYNNKPLLSKYGALCANWMKTLPDSHRTSDVHTRNAKFRLGIVSAHVRNQSVWNAILKGWVHQLDQSQFEIYLFKLDTRKDGETAAAKSHVHYFDDSSKSLSDWAATIRNAGLDALIYDEIGMNALTLQLAALRLAPIQAVTWGHPETTGLPTIDFYLSAAGLEPPNAQENYSEKVVLLPHMGVYVEMLTPEAQDPDLQMLGLPSDEPLLLCPGSPFKYSPLHDTVWIDIAKGLEAHGAGRLIFFSASSGTMHVQLIGRMRQAFSDAGLDFDRHVSIIPFLSRSQYFGLMERSALMLDTLDFSGFNTAIQSVECGLPYLAFEGRFMRGRLASCIMRRLDLPELVATTYREFAERAVALTFSEDRLRNLRAEIRQRRGILFEDAVPVRALEEFLSAEIRKRRSGVTGGEALSTESPPAQDKSFAGA
jgi:predicted O-linked N-acetylglucosamine transferase (SPINDLY family)